MGLIASDFFVVRETPLVVAYCGAADIGPDIDRLRRCADRPVVLEHLAWWAASRKQMQAFLERQRWLDTLGIEHHLLVNDEDEDELRRLQGIRGALCSANLYCDEHVFDLEPSTTVAREADGGAGHRPFAAIGIEDRFDAVYVAALKPYKRLELARLVPTLLVVSYGGDLHAFCPQLTHAKFNYRWMPQWAVAASIRYSHCGLALSAVEGQNNATVEYQLCGVPVVSTPSRGGRALFLDEASSLTVEPRAEAVAEGVFQFRAYPPSPHVVRARVLARIRKHRETFCRYVAGILNERGVYTGAETLREEIFGASSGYRARFVRRNAVDALTGAKSAGVESAGCTVN